MRVTVMTVLILLLAAAGTACRSSGRAEDRTDADRRSRLNQLDWLSGAWVSQTDNLRTEETWTSPRAGSMLGNSRTIKGDQTAFFEHLRIVENPDGTIVYHASPRGRQATPFTMVELSENRVVFENPRHDFPQRIVYWRDRQNRLHARIEGTQRGQPASEAWTYRRMR